MRIVGNFVKDRTLLRTEHWFRRGYMVTWVRVYLGSVHHFALRTKHWLTLFT
jgi:hypothetical protein